MSDRKQLDLASRITKAHHFGGSRCMEFAGRLAKRFRKRSLRLSLTMQWPRRFVRMGWSRERWFQPQQLPQWHFNFRLNLSLHAATRIEEPFRNAGQQTRGPGMERLSVVD